MFTQLSEMDSILVKGVILVIAEVIVLAMYFLLSVPVLAVLNGIIAGAPSAEMTQYSPTTLLIFDLIFALLFITPIVWFFISIWRKEKGFQYRRYY